MIHYHGLPITPETAAAKIIAGRHAMVNFGNPQQVELAFECCSSVVFDCGAYGAWVKGEPILDWKPYYTFAEEWMDHPGFDWALIPDVIDGTEEENDALISEWHLGEFSGTPIWHIHESLDRLKRLTDHWPRVALGSSGEFRTIGTKKWWHRMSEAMDVLCPSGRPLVKIHGLRMLDPFIFTKFPFSSADSTNVARNSKYDKAWTGSYQPANHAGRGVVIADRVEAFNSAPRWIRLETQEGLPFAEEASCYFEQDVKSLANQCA